MDFTIKLNYTFLFLNCNLSAAFTVCCADIRRPPGNIIGPLAARRQPVWYFWCGWIQENNKRPSSFSFVVIVARPSSDQNIHSPTFKALYFPFR
jgi:hypothetical protein